MKCPKCGSDDTGDKWVTGRKLQRYCHDCSWKEPLRTPELQVIKNTKTVWVNQFSGFCYEVYDKYGHVMEHSKAYYTYEEAKASLIKQINKMNQFEIYAPCTGILWPDSVEVVGEVIKDVPRC